MTLMTIKDILCAVNLTSIFFIFVNKKRIFLANKACLIEIFINKIITQLIIYAYSSY